MSPGVGWRPSILVVSLVLALAAGATLAPAEARDLLVLNPWSEVRRGQLLSCDAEACRLDKTTVPRRDILMIDLDARWPRAAGS